MATATILAQSAWVGVVNRRLNKESNLGIVWKKNCQILAYDQRHIHYLDIAGKYVRTPTAATCAGSFYAMAEALSDDVHTFTAVDISRYFQQRIFWTIIRNDVGIFKANNQIDLLVAKRIAGLLDMLK